MNNHLRQELLEMQAEDLRVREQIQAEGSELPYDPRMEDVHRRNARRLRAIVDKHGWPIRSLVGDDGSAAAWLVLQHAISEPELQRAYLPLLQAAAEKDEIVPWQPAYLLDRIRYFEGQPQRYGTHWATTDDGAAKRWIIEDPEHVNERRQTVGLDPIPIELEPMTPEEALSVYSNPDFVEWARKVGWM